MKNPSIKWYIFDSMLAMMMIGIVLITHIVDTTRMTMDVYVTSFLIAAGVMIIVHHIIAIFNIHTLKK
jgi:hypothetical protein